MESPPKLDPDRPILQYEGVYFPDFPIIQKTGIEKLVQSVMKAKSRDTDILMCTYPKSGTHWVDEVVRMLLLGRAEYSKSTKVAHMLEMQGVEEQEKWPSPRFYNTHFPFQYLPKDHIQKGCKVIRCLRNPKDIMVSFYNHLKRDFVTIRTGYPGTWDEYFETWMTNTKCLFDGWFNYEKGFYHAEKTGKLRNVHKMFYEDLKKDGVKEIMRLSKFLQVPCDENFAKEINEKCSFENFSSDVNKRIPKEVMQIASIDGTNFTMRKGQVGDWKNWFTAAQNKRFDELFAKEMEGIDLKFTYEI